MEDYFPADEAVKVEVVKIDPDAKLVEINLRVRAVDNWYICGPFTKAEGGTISFWDGQKYDSHECTRLPRKSKDYTTEVKEERDRFRQALVSVKEIYDMDLDTFTEKYGLLDLEEAMMTPVLLALKGTGE